MQHKTVTILLRIRVRGHFVMSNTKYHESQGLNKVIFNIISISSSSLREYYIILACRNFQIMRNSAI